MRTEQRVEVHAVPEPGLLRPAIEAALEGRSWPVGPEAAIAEVVAQVVAESTAVGPAAPDGGEVAPW